MMDSFRVGISQGIRSAAGEIVIPEFDLSPLDDDDRIECVSLPDPTILDAEDAEDLDAVILMLEAVTPSTFEPRGRLALVAPATTVSMSMPAPATPRPWPSRRTACAVPSRSASSRSCSR
jgi:hypothetical protein